MRITFVWQALREIPDDYTVFIHLIDEFGQIVAQVDQMPHENTYATSLWSAGEFVSDTATLSAIEFNEIRVGWYLQRTGVRLLLTSAASGLFNPQDYLTIPEIHSQ